MLVFAEEGAVDCDGEVLLRAFAGEVGWWAVVRFFHREE